MTEKYLKGELEFSRIYNFPAITGFQVFEIYQRNSMKWFSVLIVISLLFVLGGLAIGINPVRVTEGPPRFIFSADKIAS
jgi:hypothetical protein